MRSTHYQRWYKVNERTGRKYRVMRNYCKRDKEFDIAFYAHISNDFTDGHRGEAKARRGAKKFINSRMRFHQKMKLKDIEDD